MPPTPSPNLPKTKIPVWERRRKPDRWKWNGSRKGDPHGPLRRHAGEARPKYALLYSAAGFLIGLGILILALR